ncbi:MAG: hypothetical protein GWM98_20835, partial [Nitrospinaceae bacterium]|nr:bifunctional folylpolyglutamate synthase/dihydrofolate synthase [Nitrospinaceae bacterium]NIR56469.1 bifunctional folylpolyglutamate synthase/dihydrofolate synthase [Nitrospinaceae bacterium]NIS86930.1 bifunctional folylpolyglutamate synthase/dihydrofolate synthase [Nitrospinaceae bacterium]NIT83768.1 bifunctional folylpolyglutamate synthase/dihydrofolate synthase [Nitrospinaceae bacterium]NIU45971.1 bifunctional folylpolyglutamate synthase/dihydrofolate synthase [Nitrospinaceae bacterium]
HIAGTNGKGSTAAFCESILRRAGYRVGLYTSPHLLDFRERIRVGGLPIEKDFLIRSVNQVQDLSASQNIPLTYFEFTTVVAFLYFEAMQTDWNVVEVGLGGRLDATNVSRGDISILTSISHDHTEHLGSDLIRIAEEKACIIKDFGTVFAHLEDPEPLAVIEDMSRRRAAALHRLGTEFEAVRQSTAPRHQSLDFIWGDRILKDLRIPLIGRHQVANAALATAAALQIASWEGRVTEASIREGLESTRWEGRLEVVHERPWVLLDAAHNPDGVRKLTQALGDHFPYDRCLCVLGIMRNKPIDRMLEIFAEEVDHFILVRPRQGRSEDPLQLRERLMRYPKPVDVLESVFQGLERAKSLAREKDLICISGSLFTVAEAKETLLAHEVFKNPADSLGDLQPRA